MLRSRTLGFKRKRFFGNSCPTNSSECLFPFLRNPSWFQGSSKAVHSGNPVSKHHFVCSFEPKDAQGRCCQDNNLLAMWRCLRESSGFSLHPQQVLQLKIFLVSQSARGSLQPPRHRANIFLALTNLYTILAEQGCPSSHGVFWNTFLRFV